jgi:hypothetical protein
MCLRWVSYEGVDRIYLAKIRISGGPLIRW